MPPLKFPQEKTKVEKKAEIAAAGVRRNMQVGLRKELAKRKFIYWENLI
jgi:hypothetical protein